MVEGKQHIDQNFFYQVMRGGSLQVVGFLGGGVEVFQVLLRRQRYTDIETTIFSPTMRFSFKFNNYLLGVTVFLSHL